MPSSKSPIARRQPSLLSRWLEPLAATLWILFLVWTVLVAATWVSGAGDVELGQAIKNPDLLKALQWLLLVSDGIWVLLAAANVYLSLAASEGLKNARTRALVTLLSAWGACALSAKAHLPLGPVRYTGRLGIHLGPVPFGEPLLWFALVHGAHSAASRIAPRVRHELLALITAGLTLASDIILEPIAWKHRAWWLWYPAQIPAPGWPPVSNYISWFLIPGLLALAFREREVAKSGAPAPAQPAITFAILNAVFLLGYLGK